MTHEERDIIRCRCTNASTLKGDNYMIKIFRFLKERANIFRCFERSVKPTTYDALGLNIGLTLRPASSSSIRGSIAGFTVNAFNKGN